jgi:hypothetical protein
LTFPDIVNSGLCGSQAAGWDDRTAKSHLRDGRVLHAAVRLWDTRVRVPTAMKSARRRLGRFPINMRPRCLDTGARQEPDFDAVYMASPGDVVAWASERNCRVDFPAGRVGRFRDNALVQITKPF